MAHAGTSRGAERPLALTMGDPAGIGIEIAVKAWRARDDRAIPPFVLIADPEAIEQRLRDLNIEAGIEIIANMQQAGAVFVHKLPILPIPLAVRTVPGVADTANAPAVIHSIETAVDLVERGEAAAVVTNPIAKAILSNTGFEHPGHTEFLAALAEGHHPGERFHPVMMLSAEEVRVVPLTIHVPLSEVPRAITHQLIRDTVHVIDRALGRPRVAVAGLNPHAGESGTIGREEMEIIAPAIAELRAEGLDIRGPLPADTMFHAAARATYDVALAMYHDQALIPLKTLAFDRGVNVTLGLPFVRTSPDHGTAFDIAARGVANPESLIQALLTAEKLACARAFAVTS